MKNHQLTAPSIAALIVVMLSSVVASAQPTSSPTGGNVDARFSTVGIGVLGAESFLVDASGVLSNTTGNPVTVNDTQGFRSTVSGSVVGTAGVTGSHSDGNTGQLGMQWWGVLGYANNPGSSGVHGFANAATTKGVAGTANADSTYGVFGRADANNSTAVQGEVTAGMAGSNAGFFNNVPSGQRVTLGSPTAAVDGVGVIKNAGLTIAASGDLSDTSGAVQVVDANGFSVTAPTAPVRFAVNAATGAVSNTVGGEGARVTDPDGLAVTGSGSTNVDLVVNGRIQTGDGSNRGGMWVSSDPAESLFVGNNAYQGIGFYNAGWGLNLAPGGLVGIGTRTPASHLQISNNVGSGGFNDWSDFQLLLYEGGDPASSYGLGIESGTMAFNANNNFRFYTDNTERLGIYDSEVHMNGDVDISGKTNFYNDIYTNGHDIWGFSGTNIYAGGYINAGSYITANDIGDFEYDTSSFTLSPLQRYTACTFGSGSTFGAYFTTISGGYRLTDGSPVKIEGNYPADLYSYGKPTHWCIKAYNPSGTTSYTVYTYVFDWSPSLSPGDY